MTPLKTPKVFHTVWLGPAQETELHKTCRATWFGVGGYQWRHITHEDKLTLGQLASRFPYAFTHMKTHLKNEQWAGASDVLRLAALYFYGGIYLDCDVELLRPQELPLLTDSRFHVGFESPEMLCGAILAAPPGHWFTKLMLDIYSYVPPEETFTGNVNGSTLLTQALKLCASSAPHLTHTTVLAWTPEAFYPWHWAEREHEKRRDRITNRSIFAHHWDGSWVKEWKK